MIPVCVPTLGEAERENVIECLDTNWISARGGFVTEFESAFAAYCGCEHGVSTTSGTTALHLALESLGIGPGDEVVIPAFTMGATALAVEYCGATPVLVDATEETWNMDVEAVESKITDRTAAILPVHIYGHPVDMDPLVELGERYEVPIVEDAAEAHGSEYKGHKAGSLGDVSCFSFYANKLITCGEGGMVVTDDEDVAKRARLLKDLAYSASRRYVHSDVGFNYRMTNVQAAIGLGQLERMGEFVSMRRENARQYNDRLADLPWVRTPPEMEWAYSNYWMYAITLDETAPITRDELMEALADRGVGTRRFFVPMHRQPVFDERGYFDGQSYPVAEDIARRGMYLPSASHLRPEQIQEVSDAIRAVVETR